MTQEELIQWGTTTIRELSNNPGIVPNSRISETLLTNLALPQDEQSVVIQVGVSCDSDLGQVERVTIEVGEEIQRELDGALTSHTPFTQYHTFGDSSINFSVILRARTHVDRYLMTHEFIKLLHSRYEKEGIEIPFPQRVLHIDSGDSLQETPASRHTPVQT